MYRDFIGPQMDTGFRLGALATPRKFMISIETAYFLGPGTRYDEFPCRLPVHYDGTFSLKGVLRGAPYPVFWIDTMSEDEMAKAEDKIMAREPISDEKTSAYCTQFFKSNSEYIMRPFVAAAHHPNYKSISDNYLGRLIDTWGNYKEKLDTLNAQQKAIGGQQPSGTAADIMYQQSVDVQQVSSLIEQIVNDIRSGQSKSSS